MTLGSTKWVTTTVWSFEAPRASWSPAATSQPPLPAATVVPSTVTFVIVNPAGVAGVSMTAADVPSTDPELVTVTV